MNPILVIAGNTLRQTVRQRLFLNIGIFGIGMVLLAMLVGSITYGFPDRVVRSIGLSGVTIAVDLMALLLGVGLIHEEIDRKTLFVVQGGSRLRIVDRGSGWLRIRLPDGLEGWAPQAELGELRSP